jgi:hypothetical protein
VAAGASGIFLAIANANEGINTPEEYAKFSEPFDRTVLDAVGDAPMNTLHIHGDKVYLDRFYKGWRATVLNYSSHGTGIPIAKARGGFSEVIMGGLDERNFRTLTHLPMKRTPMRAASISSRPAALSRTIRRMKKSCAWRKL